MYWFSKRKYPGEPPWWLINGIINENVVAAYKFNGRNSVSEALKDLSGHGNTLTNNSCSWSASDGFTVSVANQGSVTAHYLDNSSVRASCKSIVMKIASVSRIGILSLSGGWNGLSVWLSTPFATQGWWYENSGAAGFAHGNGINTDQRPDGTLPRTSVQLATSGNYGSGGTIGFSGTSEAIYLDGTASSKAVATFPDHGEWTAYWSADIPRLIGGIPPLYDSGAAYNSAAHWIHNGSFTVQAFAAYNVDLNASQQADAYKNMMYI